MKKLVLALLIALLVFSKSTPSIAFLGVKEIFLGIKGLINTVNEINLLGQAIEEFIEELGIDNDLTSESRKAQNELIQIENLAKNMNYTQNEIYELIQDEISISDLKSQIQRTTQLIRSGKKAFLLTKKVLSKNKDMNFLMLSEAKKEHLRKDIQDVRGKLRKLKKNLLQEKRHKEELKKIRDELKNQGAKIYRGTPIFAFPDMELALKKAIETSFSLRSIVMTSSIVLSIFLWKIIFLQMQFRSSTHYGSLLLELFLFYGLLYFYPFLFETSYELLQAIGRKIIDFKIDPLGTLKNTDYLKRASFWTKGIYYFLEFIPSLLFALLQWLSQILIQIWIIAFPLVVWLSFILDSKNWITRYLSGFFIICLWPSFFGLLGKLASHFWNGKTLACGDKLVALLFQFFQLYFPFQLIQGKMKSLPFLNQSFNYKIPGLPDLIGKLTSGKFLTSLTDHVGSSIQNSYQEIKNGKAGLSNRLFHAGRAFFSQKISLDVFEERFGKIYEQLLYHKSQVANTKGEFSQKAFKHIKEFHKARTNLENLFVQQGHRAQDLRQYSWYREINPYREPKLK